MSRDYSYLDTLGIPSPASPADDVAGLIERAEQLAASLNRGSADIVLELAAALSRLQARLAEVTIDASNHAARAETAKRERDAADASAAPMREALTKIRQTDVGNDTTGSVVRAYADVIRIADAALGGQHGK